MKILWLCNMMLPRIAEAMHLKSKSVGGGWLTGISNALLTDKDNQLIVCVPSTTADKMAFLPVDSQLSCCIYPEADAKRYLPATRTVLRSIVEQTAPDIIHVFGTEFPRTLSMVEAAEDVPLVISITGMISVLKNYYFGAVPHSLRRKWTLHTLLSKVSHIPTLYQGYADFERRAIYEVKAIEQAKHVIGRTSWDHACTTQINPEIYYHFCNETLRDSFYNDSWNYENCEKHTIVIPQIGYPIKGFEQFLGGLAIIKKRFPDVKVFVPGHNVFCGRNPYKRKLAVWLSDYNHYLAALMKKYDLCGNICFCDSLNEQAMKDQMLKANVFVMPSAIENSPNTLGEAMLLGVPSVASCVGGVQNLAKDKKDAFIYPYSEPYMMAHYVCKLFENPVLAGEISANARANAGLIYSREKNRNRLMAIYSEIIGDKNHN